jgi:putative pyruvate formate lyase activating enzyme
MRKKIASAEEILQACCLCPRRCGANRMNEERGFCGIGGKAVVASVLPHFGEEPPLSGSSGAGTVFFSGCTLSCLYCQNYQISQEKRGRNILPSELSAYFLDLQSRGCHNVELVSPTPHIPFILEALEQARCRGLSIPLVYNTNGFLSEESLRLLDGVVDIYVPDMKYASDDKALRLSVAPHYVKHNHRSVKEMARQAGGSLLCDDWGIAWRGIMIRILLLPDGMEGALETIDFLAREKLTDVPLSLMSQYAPYRASLHSDLSGTISPARKDLIISSARKAGFSDLWLQEEASAYVFVPDFEKAHPFGEENAPP